MNKIINLVEGAKSLVHKKKNQSKRLATVLGILINHLDCIGIIKLFSVDDSKKLFVFLIYNFLF